MASRKGTGSGSKSTLMSSNGEPRREADAGRTNEGPQTKAEEARESADVGHNGDSRGSARSERAWQERGTQDARSGPGMQGRQPSDEPDVFLDVPKVHVGEIYLDVERLVAHLSLRAKVANLVQITAGVHVDVGKVELDIKDVDVQALLKVRLENLYDILDRTLTTLDRNPEILQTLLNTVDTAVDDIGHTAQQALGPGGAVGQAVNAVGQVGQQAAEGVGGVAQQAVRPGGAVSETTDAAGRAAQGLGSAAGQATQGVAQDTQGAARAVQSAEQDAQDADSSGGKSKRRSPTAADKRGTKIRSAAARSPKRTTSGKASSSRSASSTKRTSARKQITTAKRGSK
jgi:hypothetical protein